jgi:hypothetical protein
MKLLLGLFLVFNAAVACASDLAKIAGKYTYEKYQVTLKDGRVLHFQDLAARGAIIEFRKDATIVMSMHMLDGNTITTNAHIKEIKINGNKGYWIAQWPDMNYPVRKDFSFHDGVFEYEIKFEKKEDRVRYGAVEHALLRSTNAF